MANAWPFKSFLYSVSSSSIDSLSTIDSKPARNTVAECYTEIISDLKNSTELLSGDFNKGKVNRWASERRKAEYWHRLCFLLAEVGIY